MEHEVPKDSRERAEDTSIWCRKAEDEALRNIIKKLSEERNFYRTIQQENDSRGYFL